MARHDNVQHFCWEQILRTNRLFRVSHLFAPAQLSDQLLALHALFASIELVNCEISEELVARQKLAWWRAELLQRDAAGSQHPVVRHLCATGAFEKLPEPALRVLLDSAESRIDALAPANEDDFMQLCQEVYRPQVLLESALGEIDVTPDSFNAAMLFNGGLIQLLRENGRRKEHAFWWIPLSLLARFKLNRTELGALLESEEQQALFARILELREPSVDLRLFDTPPGFVNGAGQVHLQLMLALQSRQLDRLQGMSPATYRSELARWRIGDLVTTWKRARRLQLKSDQ